MRLLPKQCRHQPLTSVSAANIIEKEAADVLLENQLPGETLPERLLKNNEKITKVQLAEESYQHQGDPSRHCGSDNCSSERTRQQSRQGVAGLITTGEALEGEQADQEEYPPIFANLSTKSLTNIDVGNNNLKGQCSTAIAEYFKNPNMCKY